MPNHAERRFLPYRPDQMYDLVADVQRYPEFLPWCTGCRVTSRKGNVITADLIIGFKMIRERFGSRVTFHPEEQRIDVEYTSGPLRYLNNHWVFEPAQGGTVIDFYVDFEFNSRLLQSVIETLFTEAVKRMVKAFEDRADVLYGRPEPRISGQSATQS